MNKCVAGLFVLLALAWVGLSVSTIMHDATACEEAGRVYMYDDRKCISKESP